MTGEWINNHQVEIYMKARKAGLTQVTSAAKAGISERSGRDIEQGNRVDPKTKQRHWRTKPDPFSDVWDSHIVPRLEKMPTINALTLLEDLQDSHPGKYPDNLLRTMQRRVKNWKALHGAEKEVMFRQEHLPGKQALSDFTELKKVTITIKGKLLRHRLYHFRLAYSGWSYMKVIKGGESYTALAEGLQEALYRLGGSPSEHRTDSLSAAFKNLSKEARQDITERYESFCDHYQMKASRNNLGAKHENGSIESAHGHLKRRIEQALLLRGSNDFGSVEEYQKWLDQVVKKHNRRNAKLIEVEREHLQALPTHKTADYTEVVAKVSSSSTIEVRKVTYSVPSRFIGEVLRIHLYDDRLACHLGCKAILKLNRVYPTGKTTRARNIDYRHLVHSLVKKPGAFRGSILRDDLLPNNTYRKIWEHVDTTMPAKESGKFMVNLLHLAATENCENELGKVVMEKILQEKSLRISQLQDQFQTRATPQPEIEVLQHQLRDYDYLIPSKQEVAHV